MVRKPGEIWPPVKSNSSLPYKFVNSKSGSPITIRHSPGGLVSNLYYYYRNYSILLVFIKRVLKPTQQPLTKRFYASDQEPGGEPASRKSILAEGALMLNSCATAKTVYSIAEGCNGYKYPES